LARRRTLVFDPAPDPVALLKGFSSDISSGIDFLFQCGGSAAFLGSATEDLFERDGRSLSARTLAATFRESEVESMDRRVSFTALLNSFRHHCVSYEVKEPKLADRTQKPEHVRLTGRVAEGVTDEDLLNSFHPSPLMSGVPIDDACRLIDQWEDFDRGWFGGAVGLIGADKTEIGVADKAFLMEGNRVYAYRASGIVAGADPRRTWERLGP
jgi:menaquinone-specific isochorismate synthase